MQKNISTQKKKHEYYVNGFLQYVHLWWSASVNKITTYAILFQIVRQILMIGMYSGLFKVRQDFFLLLLSVLNKARVFEMNIHSVWQRIYSNMNVTSGIILVLTCNTKIKPMENEVWRQTI